MACRTFGPAVWIMSPALRWKSLERKDSRNSDSEGVIPVGELEELIGTSAYWSLSSEGLLAHRDGYGVSGVTGITPFASKLRHYVRTIESLQETHEPPRPDRPVLAS